MISISAPSAPFTRRRISIHGGKSTPEKVRLQDCDTVDVRTASARMFSYVASAESYFDRLERDASEAASDERTPATPLQRLVAARMLAEADGSPSRFPEIAAAFERSKLSEIAHLFGLNGAEAAPVISGVPDDEYARFASRTRSFELDHEFRRLIAAIDSPQARHLRGMMPVEKPATNQRAVLRSYVLRNDLPQTEKQTMNFSLSDFFRRYGVDDADNIDSLQEAGCYERSGADAPFIVGVQALKRGLPEVAVRSFGRSKCGEARLLSGIMHLDGTLPTDFTAAIVYFEQAGTPRSKTYLAALLLAPPVGKSDFAAATQLLREAAYTGDSLALCRLAAMRLTGEYMKPNHADAVTLLVDNGSVEALIALAVMHYNGVHFARDPRRARRLLRSIDDPNARRVLEQMAHDDGMPIEYAVTVPPGANIHDRRTPSLNILTIPRVLRNTKAGAA